jgi:hypothetical protein
MKQAAVRSGRSGAFDWHGDPIMRKTPVTATYRNTQNVRRFFKAQCGDHFKFDRPFMAWMKNGRKKTMGAAVEEWLRREAIPRYIINATRPIALRSTSNCIARA